MCQGLNDLVVSLLLIHLSPLLIVILFSSLGKLILQLLDDIEVSVGDFLVIRFNISIFLSVFSGQLLDGLILLILNKLDLLPSLILHLGSQIKHLLLILGMDLISDPLELMPSLGLLLVLFFGQSI